MNSIPLILVPGMMCDERLYTPQTTGLQAHAITVASITQHDTVERLAREVLDNAPAEFALAGLSMGGIVAMEMVRQAPERVERLCLMDTNPLAEKDEIRAAREPQIAKVQQGKLLEVMRDEMKPNYLANGERRQEILDLCMDMALALGADVFVRQSRALQNRPDQCKTLKNYKRPTLILHGREDRLCPASRHELMYSLMPHANYEVIDDAGHLPTLEQPKVTNILLTGWLRTV